MLRFRAIGKRFEYWPVGITLIVPSITSASLWIIAGLLGFSAVTSTVAAVAGVIITLLGCVHLLVSPSTEILEFRLASIPIDLKHALDAEQRCKDQLERIESPYQSAKTRHEQALRTLTEWKQQIERERQQYLASVQYQKDQLAQRNWRAMRGPDFEQFMREVFKTLGYQVQVTGASGDQGVDLIVTLHGRRIAIQLKGYLNSVGNSAVQEAYAGMTYYGCHACVVITNSVFTSSAKELAARVGCALIDEEIMPALIMGQVRL